MSYYTKITKVGLAAIAAALNDKTKLPITYMAFGDGNGSIPEPDENATALVHEVYRTGLNKVEIHNKNPNWLVCEAIIPSAVGGFNIREVGLFDNTGSKLLAVANYPPTYKPNTEEGAAKIQTIRIVLQVDNTGNFELVIDPDVVLATVAYLQENLLASKIKIASGRNQEEKNTDIVDIVDFGGVSDNSTDNANAWNNLEAANGNIYEATLAGGNYKRTPPTSIEPNLRYSYYPPYCLPAVHHIQHGTESQPESDLGQVTSVVRRVASSTRNYEYEEQIGTTFHDLKIKGSGDVNNPHLCGWVGSVFNIYKEVKHAGGKLDQKGSVVGLTTFAGADYLDSNRLISGLWARAVSPKPSDEEFNQIGGSWHTVGAEINARVRHKDTGYSSSAVKGSSVGLMIYNNVRAEDIPSGSALTARNNTFGIMFAGGAMAGLDSSNIENHNGFWTGIQFNLIKNRALDFPNNVSPNAVGLKFSDTRIAGKSYKTAIDIGNNKMRFGAGSFGYDTAENGDVWYNGGTFFVKDSLYNSVTSRFMIADSFAGSGMTATDVFTPTHFLKVRWNATTKFKIPAILETV